MLPPLQRPPLLAAALGAAALLLAGCGASHRLAEVDLSGRTVAVIAAVPPGDVVAGPWPMAHERRYLPSGPVARRAETARRAQGRLTAAARRVDVAEVVARRALVGAARELGFQPAANPREADFVLDVRLLDYGLRARSFNSPVVLVAEADVVLVERATEEVVWRRRVRERAAVSAEAFGYEGRRITAAELAELSEDDMAQGLQHLAILAADRIVERLEGAYMASR